MTNNNESVDLNMFASGLYTDDSVKLRCLELQNSYNVNVDVVLWLCWLDANGIYLKRNALEEAKCVVGGVNQDLLLHLRESRFLLSAASTFTKVQEKLIRKSILSAELSIEKVLLQRLQDLLSRLDRADDEDEALSLFDYLENCGIPQAGVEAAQLLEKSRSYVTDEGAVA